MTPPVQEWLPSRDGVINRSACCCTAKERNSWKNVLQKALSRCLYSCLDARMDLDAVEKYLQCGKYPIFRRQRRRTFGGAVEPTLASTTQCQCWNIRQPRKGQQKRKRRSGQFVWDQRQRSDESLRVAMLGSMICSQYCLNWLYYRLLFWLWQDTTQNLQCLVTTTTDRFYPPRYCRASTTAERKFSITRRMQGIVGRA